MPLPANAPFEPPATVTSPVAKPVTSSEKVKVAVKASVALIASGTPVISSVGAAVSTVKVAVCWAPWLPAASQCWSLMAT